MEDFQKKIINFKQFITEKLGDNDKAKVLAKFDNECIIECSIMLCMIDDNTFNIVIEKTCEELQIKSTDDINKLTRYYKCFMDYVKSLDLINPDNLQKSIDSSMLLIFTIFFLNYMDIRKKWTTGEYLRYRLYIDMRKKRATDEYLQYRLNEIDKQPINDLHDYDDL